MSSLPLTERVFFNYGKLNPMLVRRMLTEAAASGEVTFPQGICGSSILPWISDNPWMFLEASSGSPDSVVLDARYGHLGGIERVSGPGFPLDSVLEVLEMLAQGQHPRFVAAAWEVLGELCDPGIYGEDNVPIVFAKDP